MRAANPDHTADGRSVLGPARVVPLDPEHEEQVVRSLAAMLAALAEEGCRSAEPGAEGGPEAA